LNPLFQIARRVQGAADLLPKRWQLPLRYRVQSAIGGLEPEFSVLPQLVPGGMAALDIGANMGVYTYALAGIARHVHSFEPQAACCDVIASWAANRNVTVHHVGVGSAPGDLILHVPVVDGRRIGTRASFTAVEGPHEDVRVPIITIDSLGIEGIGFIKIDVEGFEHDVLVGAEKTLRRWQPALLVELDRGRQSRESFDRSVGFLHDLGYAASVLDGGRLVGCGDNAWEVAERHYNFIFTAAAKESTAGELAGAHGT
jgi:FkbM family methyltransferase